MKATTTPTQRIDDPRAQADFEQLYRTAYGQLLVVALATTGDRTLAEDMTQDAFAQLWRRWGQVNTPHAWLRKAVVSNCLDALRTERRRVTILRDRVAPALTRTETDNLADTEPGDFARYLHGLNDRQRAAITLRYVADLSEADIATALGCRPGTVKSMLHRATRIIRGNLQGGTR